MLRIFAVGLLISGALLFADEPGFFKLTAPAKWGGPPPHNPLMDALDLDHDHVISAEEIKSAITALMKLDKNGDGKLTEDEIRPQPPGEGFGPPPREGDAGPGRPPREVPARSRGTLA